MLTIVRHVNDNSTDISCLVSVASLDTLRLEKTGETRGMVKITLERLTGLTTVS